MRVLTEQRGEIGLIRVIGEVDAAAAPELLAALIDATCAARAVELDLRRVTFVDRAGKRALHAAEEAAVASRCHLVIRRPRLAARRVVEAA